ncbi:MAG: TIGR03905 family TSCPD domain-containing protein [Bacteroidaceae bacterium]|jgi:uncharacterized protein (TIGR03905 family)
MEYHYKTNGTCSTDIYLNVEDGIIRDVRYEGGCNGNLQGIAQLVRGMAVSEVLARLEHIRCGMRRTSCPDQLCKALREMGYND